MNYSNVGPVTWWVQDGLSAEQDTCCLLTECDRLCTCQGGMQRSLRCVFQSLRSRRGLRPSLHLWIVCVTKTHINMDAQGCMLTYVKCKSRILLCCTVLFNEKCDLCPTDTQSRSLQLVNLTDTSQPFVFSVTVVSYFMGFSRACP